MKALVTATILSGLALLSSCDRSSATNPAAPVAEVEQPLSPAQLYGARITSSLETLPLCSPELTALLFYVQSEGTLQYCDGEKYIVISLKSEQGTPIPNTQPEPASYNGVTIYSGDAAPLNAIGIQHDLFFNLATGDVYEKGESAWAISFNTVGPKGTSGESGVDGDDGDDGEQGIQGSKGERGLSGLNGSNCTVSETTDSVSVSCDNGTSVDFGKGVDGNDGDTGSQGPQGDKGDRGEKGVKGDDGTSCSIESRTTSKWVVCTDGTEVKVPEPDQNPGSTIHTGNQEPEAADGENGDTYIEYAAGHTIYWEKSNDTWAVTSLVDNLYDNFVYSLSMMGVDEPDNSVTDTTYIETDSFVRWVKLSTPINGWAIKHDPDSAYLQDNSQFYATQYNNNIFAYKLIVAQAPLNTIDTLYFLEQQANPNNYDIKSYYTTEQSYNNDSLFIYNKNQWHHSLIENLKQGDTCDFAIDRDKYRYSKIEASILACFNYGPSGQLWTKIALISSSI
ncbi:MAG: collagen-like protein [Fibrobacterales bacterium]